MRSRPAASASVRTLAGGDPTSHRLPRRRAPRGRVLRGRPQRLLAGAALAAGLLLAGASPASAHESLVSSDPVDGSAVDAPPQAVTLTFSGAMQTDFAQVAVIDPSGAQVAQGPPQVAGETLTQAVAATQAGAYQVSYRVVSADGHPEEGQLGFTVTTAAPPGSGWAPAPNAEPAPEPSMTALAESESSPSAAPSATTAAAASSDGGSDDSGLPTWAVLSTGILAVAGVSTVAVARLRRGAAAADNGVASPPAT